MVKKFFLSIRDVFSKLSFIINKKQKIYCVIVFMMTVIGVGFETLGVSAILPFVQAMLYPEQLMENELIVGMAEIFHIKTDSQIILFVSVGVIVIYLVKNLYLIFLSYVRANFAGNIQNELGVYMLQAYLKRDYAYFLKANSNKLYRGITGDISGVYNIIYNGFRLISEIFTVVTIGIFILWTDFLMSLLLLVIAGISVIIIMAINKNRMKYLGEKVRRYDAKMKDAAYQAFHGVKEVFVMNKQKFFEEEYADARREHQRAMISQTVAAESPIYIFEAVCVIAMVIAVFLRLLLDGGNAGFISNVAVIAVAAFRIMPSLGRIAGSMNTIIFNIPSVNATYNNLKEATEHEKNVQQYISIKDSASNLEFEKELLLENVSWKYEDADSAVIQNLSLSINKGDSVAFIGESGAGKSTLADVILGLFRPLEGKVYMDGIDIREIPQNWCKVIGYVPQSVYILNASIRKNVAFGVREKEIDDELVWKALEQAQIKDFIENLPEKLDTVLGERGVRFSGGQRQRIAIARALYYDPEILVLDEATSALDNRTEEGIMEAIEFLKGKKTLIIVAHRLTTIRQCNQIYEIKDGQAILRRKEDIL